MLDIWGSLIDLATVLPFERVHCAGKHQNLNPGGDAWPEETCAMAGTMNCSRCATIQIRPEQKSRRVPVDVHINDLTQHGIVSYVHPPVDAIRMFSHCGRFSAGLWPMRVVREAKKISVGGNHH